MMRSVRARPPSAARAECGTRKKTEDWPRPRRFREFELVELPWQNYTMLNCREDVMARAVHPRKPCLKSAGNIATWAHSTKKDKKRLKRQLKYMSRRSVWTWDRTHTGGFWGLKQHLTIDRCLGRTGRGDEELATADRGRDGATLGIESSGARPGVETSSRTWELIHAWSDSPEKRTPGTCHRSMAKIMPGPSPIRSMAARVT